MNTILEMIKGAGYQIWPLFVYAIAINSFTFAVFALDKWKSQNNRWRIPERTLLTLALIGGSPAMVFGQKLLRHKTQKQPFARLLKLIILLQAAAAVFLMIAIV